MVLAIEFYTVGIIPFLMEVFNSVSEDESEHLLKY